MRSGRVGAAIAIASSLFIAGLVSAPAAGASEYGCGGAHNEAELRAQNHEPCRMTFIIDPGAGNMVSRSTLLANAGMYDQLGFDRNFLLWAGERVIPGAGQHWTHCTDNGSDDSCANNSWAGGPVSNTFADDAEPPLTVFGDSAAFIAQVCGNSKVGVRVNDRYHPTLTGEKFHDRNRDGVRQAGEEPLAGWTFQIEKVDAAYGSPGLAGHATTGADGRWSFDLVHATPGTYRISEIAQDGWAETPSTQVREVVVPAGAESARFDVGVWANTQTRADVAKTEFRLVDPPSRIDADTPTELTVRVGLLNHGPADAIQVVDTVTASSPNPDCSFSPAEVVLRRELAVGVPDVTDVTVTVTCTEPSDHEVSFDDALTVATRGITDPDPSNNAVAFTRGVEVFDSSDLELSEPELTCPERTDIEEAVVCTAEAVMTNVGPYGPTSTDADLILTTPADCAATVVAGTEPDVERLAVGDTRRISQSWSVVCAQRSFHPMRAAVTSRTDHLHVEDRNPGNDTVTADDVVEVFESADLGIWIDDLVCTEREADPTASSCTATVEVTNHGSGTGVQTVATTLSTPADDCTVTPSAAEADELVLAVGETRTLTRVYQLACADPVRHDVIVDAEVAAGEPHAEDRNSVNNKDRLIWIPSDAKPYSLPSAVNVAKQGILPLALLATERINTVSQVDSGTVRAGATGTEDSVGRCAAGGEDVNDDGRSDLTCKTDTVKSGLACTSTVLVVTGRLDDGTRFISQDDVKVTGCGG